MSGVRSKIATAIAESRAKGEAAGREFRRRVVGTLQRLFPTDANAARDQALESMHNELGALKTLFLAKVQQDQKELAITRDLQDRLEWHELMGPLKESKAKLDRRRNKGIITLSDHNRNGN
jgi:hypothetical protein